MAATIGGHHLQLKEQLWLTERVFQNGSLHKGLPIAIERRILIGWTGSHFRGALKYAMPLKRLGGRPWMQIGTKIIAESPQGHSLNTALVRPSASPGGAIWLFIPPRLTASRLYHSLQTILFQLVETYLLPENTGFHPTCRTYSKTSLIDHLHRSITPLYRPFYLGPKQ